MNIKKQYKITLRLYKIADIGDQQKIHTKLWTAVKSSPRDSLGNKSNRDHPDTSEPYFQKPLL